SLRFAVARYDPGGILDPSFGSGGTVTTAVGDSAVAHAIAVQPDGNIVTVGYSMTAGNFDFTLVRYDASGNLDPTFGTGGMVVTDLGGDDLAQGVALQPDGRIVVGGFSSSSPTSTADDRFALARYEADGSLDRTFAPCAVVMTPFPPVGSIGSHATALLVQPDGKLVAVGDALDDFALTRYVGTGGASACEPAAVGKATLRLRSDVNTRHPHLAWRWIGASAVVRSDFGDPTDATDLTLCVLDGSGALKLAATTPANP